MGFSCCFRQWRAKSHCNKLHGYAIQVSLKFESDKLDVRNWVVDFGALKAIKERLEYLFDHKTLVAQDDPLISSFREMHQAKMIDLVIVDAVGCEKFADLIFNETSAWLAGYNEANGTDARLVEVEVREHGANSAIRIA